jgi:hypothetical protein
MRERSGTPRFRTCRSVRCRSRGAYRHSSGTASRPGTSSHARGSCG